MRHIRHLLRELFACLLGLAFDPLGLRGAKAPVSYTFKEIFPAETAEASAGAMASNLLPDAHMAALALQHGLELNYTAAISQDSQAFVSGIPC